MKEVWFLVMQVQREFRSFRKDVRPGRLLFLATCPNVERGGTMTLSRQAGVILRRFVWDAVCVVVCGKRKVSLFYNELGNDGRPVRVHEEQHDVPYGVSKLAHGISLVDSRPGWGLAKPVVGIGYHVVGRAISARSDKRVITHEILCYQLGKTAAAVRQAGMRPAGSTREVRITR